MIKESEWQRERQIHYQAVRDTQREEDEALPTLEFVPLYQQSAEKKSKDNGGKTMAKSKSDIEKAVIVDKIIREVFKKTKANISVGQLLEIGPCCNLRVMAALQEEEEENAAGHSHSYHV